MDRRRDVLCLPNDASADVKKNFVSAAAKGLVQDALAAGLDIYQMNGVCIETDRSKISGTLFTQEFLDSVATPSVKEMKKEVQTMVGRCELAFRASPSTESAVVKHAYLLEEAKVCSYEHAALIANMYNGNDAFGMVLHSVGIATNAYAFCYGVRHNIERDANMLIAAYAKIGRMTHVLFHIMRSYKIMTHATSFSASAEQTALLPTCKTIAEGIGRLRGVLQHKTTTFPPNVRSRVVEYMMARHELITKTGPMLASLRARIEEHVHSRQKSSLCWVSVDAIGIDILVHIIEFVDFRSASACLQTCKEMNNISQLKSLLPHLSVRWIPGVFPHVIAASTESGECGYIARKTLVHLYTDFVIKGAKRTDSESVRLQTTPTEQAGSANVGFVTREERMRQKRDDENSAARLCFRDEVVDPNRFRRRLGHETFFQSPIHCTYDLVFADSLEAVPSTTSSSAIVLSKSMRKPNAPCSTYTSLRGVPYPARVDVYIDALSGSHHTSRKFKIRVTGVATTMPNITKQESSIYQQKLVSYSPPFEIVSTKKVSATVRQRAQEKSARKRNKA
jgi:hypothetical protein